MAIAALEYPGGLDDLGAVGEFAPTAPRPNLQVVRLAGPVEGAEQPTHLRLGVDVASRRAARQAARLRRRRVTLAVLAAGMLIALALPVSVLGGRASDGASSLPGAEAGGPGVSYVVQPGDTLRSIAGRVDPADPGKLARTLAAQTGSPVVVPGEHLLLP